MEALAEPNLAEDLANPKLVYDHHFFEGLKPDPILTVSEWADKNRILSNRTSSEPGKWRTSRTPYLQEVMDELSISSKTQKIVFMKAAQIGGALDINTPLPTPNGWVTMGDVKIGDKLFDENGKVCRVTYKSKIFKDHECYEMTFSDNSKIICDDIHKWEVQDENNYRYIKKVVLTTPELFKTYKNGQRNRYSIAVQQSLKCRGRKLPIDPYLLGIWLGDGNRYTGQLYLNKNDSKQILKKIDRKCIVRKDSKDCVNVLIEGFYSELRVENLLRTKRIPQIFLRASEDQRLELLQGLMDSDGSISNNRCEYSTRDKDLFEGVFELLMSLGIKASVYHSKTDRGFGKKLDIERDQWRISFTIFDKSIFHLKRKLGRMKTKGRISETKKRRIINIKKIPTVPTACIEVDSPNHLYLCGRQMVPTHNTEAGNNWMGYVIDHFPGPMMLVQPTVMTVIRNSKQRIDPLIEDCPALNTKIKSKKARDSGNTLLQKDFPGGTLILTGANSAVGLRSMPAKFIFLDEVDGYPTDADGEGDPVKLAQARSRTFADRKAFLVSTPTIQGRSKIEAEYENSDKRRYHLPCPFCGEFQHLKFKQLKWPKGKTEEVYYECEHCKEKIKEHHKTKMLSEGKWVAERPGYKNGGIVGFHINSLYSPLGWFSWQEIADEWLDCKGSPDKLKGFINTILGETWKEKGDSPDWQRLYDRRENYEIGTVPKDGLFLTAGVDVQKGRLECQIKAWGEGKQSWSIDNIILPGEISDDKVWNDLEEILYKMWPHESGVLMPLSIMAVDSGYETHKVYSWVRKFNLRKVIAIKGVSKSALMVGIPKAVEVNDRGKKITNGVQLWPVGVDLIKTELYSWLHQDRPTEIGKNFPNGYCHFPQYDADFFKQLTAEQTVTVKKKGGYSVSEWQKIRERNEALDTSVYARAAAIVFGIDRFEQKHWDTLRSQLIDAKKQSNIETEEKLAKENSDNFKKNAKKRKLKKVKRENSIW